MRANSPPKTEASISSAHMTLIQDRASKLSNGSKLSISRQSSHYSAQGKLTTGGGLIASASNGEIKDFPSNVRESFASRNSQCTQKKSDSLRQEYYSSLTKIKKLQDENKDQ